MTLAQLFGLALVFVAGFLVGQTIAYRKRRLKDFRLARAHGFITIHAANFEYVLPIEQAGVMGASMYWLATRSPIEDSPLHH